MKDMYPDPSALTADELAVRRDKGEYHMSWETERELWDMVRRGDVELLRERASQFEIWGVGRIAKTSLRQEKNLLIAATTLATRAAVEGGVPVEHAYSLSDSVITAGEDLSTSDAVIALKRRMLADFAGLVVRFRCPSRVSPEIARCIDYLSKHLLEPVSLSDLASAVNLGPTHVSRKFHRETGMTVTGWLRRERVREACSLLSGSARPIPDIAVFLGFSSQSWFTACFRRETGKTPLEWRKGES